MLSPPQLSPLGAAAPRGPWPGLPPGTTASVPYCRRPSHPLTPTWVLGSIHATALEGGRQVSPPPGRPSGCSESQDQDQHWACETLVSRLEAGAVGVSPAPGDGVQRGRKEHSHLGGGPVFLFGVPGQKQPIPSAPTTQTGKLRPELAGTWGPRGVGGCAGPEPRPPGQCTLVPVGPGTTACRKLAAGTLEGHSPP